MYVTRPEPQAFILDAGWLLDLAQKSINLPEKNAIFDASSRVDHPAKNMETLSTGLLSPMRAGLKTGLALYLAWICIGTCWSAISLLRAGQTNQGVLY